MIGQLFVRAFAFAGKTVLTVATQAVVTELKKPETQQKLAETAAKAGAHGARALGRAYGTLKNRP